MVEQLKREGRELGIPETQLNAWAMGASHESHTADLQRMIDEWRKRPGSAA